MKNPKDSYCNRNIPRIIEKIRKTKYYVPTVADINLENEEKKGPDFDFSKNDRGKKIDINDVPDPQDLIPKTLKQYFFSETSAPGLLKSYDAIGFDADTCLIRFKVKELTRVLI
jgi:hypothetical protein